jgi:ABC-2 type transport system permease protein
VTGQLRAELLKQRSTQTTLGLLLAMVGLVALAVVLHVFGTDASDLTTRSQQLSVFEVGTRVGMLFAGLVGAIAITGELRYGTIRPTFLATPRRSPVLVAKVMVSALAGIVFGLLAEALMMGAVSAGFAARGIEIQLGRDDFAQLITGGTAAAALWATIGLGIGALVRNQVASLVGVCAWLLLVENLLISFLSGVGRLVPGEAGLALAGAASSKLVAPAVGALLLVLYAAAAAAAGWVSTVRRDVA